MAKVTLQSIADTVGVSRMTVSNAFSRPDQLSAELRERILAAAAELDYSGPDPAARALARGRTGAIGLLLNGTVSEAFEDAVSSQLVASVADALAEESLALTVLTPPQGGYTPAREVAMDGALVYSCNAQTAGLDWLERRGIPTVTIDEDPREGVPGVNIDDRGGARAAAEHLIGLGHTRIGILALQDAELPGPEPGSARLGRREAGAMARPPARGQAGRLVSDGNAASVPASRRAAGRGGPIQAQTDLTTASRSYPTQQRLLGWHDALDAAGITPVIQLAPFVALEAAMAAARELLEEGVTAVLCFSDVFAQYVVRAADDLGLVVPRDLSVVGFDDNPLAAAMRPPLTTVRQDVAGKGRAAVAALAAVLSGERPASVLLPTELVVRGSTGPAPAR